QRRAVPPRGEGAAPTDRGAGAPGAQDRGRRAHGVRRRMSGPVRLDVFSDYLCPWCYNAAVRIGDVEREYGDRVAIHWRAFPLIPDQQPGRLVSEKMREGRRRVAAEEPRAPFVIPALDSALPSSSVPAQTAAKCAERQGAGAFARFHAALFRAQFSDNLDI